MNMLVRRPQLKSSGFRGLLAQGNDIVETVVPHSDGTYKKRRDGRERASASREDLYGLNLP